MREISRAVRRTWLRTDRPVIPTNTATWHHLLVVEKALQHGLFAAPDPKRPEFYEIEVNGNWYYIHIPSRIAGVYLIAAVRNGAREALLPVHPWAALASSAGGTGDGF